MPQKWIDLHCHLLPGVDDGSKTTAESLRALKAAAEQGAVGIILTPHHNRDLQIPPTVLLEKMIDLQEKARENGLNLPLYSGQECMYYSGLAEALERRKALTLAGSRYVLVEFWEDVGFPELKRGLSEIREAGFFPVLAHYERYDCLRKTEHLDTLKSEGIVLQMNFSTIRYTRGIFHTSSYRQEIQKGYVDLFASDCHGTAFRPYKVTPAMQWLEKNVSRQELDRMLHKNPQKILNGEKVV